MSQNANEFFEEKKSWSTAKDMLLKNYLPQYLTKIAKLHCRLVYIDGFAGKGKFDDGSIGSPLIALEEIAKYNENGSPHLVARTIFVEKKFSKALKENLSNYPTAEVFSEPFEKFFEEEMPKLQQFGILFMYLDPFGYSSLKFDIYKRLRMMEFQSVELLINFNSFGFIRNACKLLKMQYYDDDLGKFLEEPEESETIFKEVQKLNDIAGGDYWQDILKNNIEMRKIKGMNVEAVNGKTAEIDFKNAYCEKLREIFGFVLEMPVAEKDGTIPKYRMLHLTNHKEGYLLMVDNICQRWKALRDSWNNGQLLLFDNDKNLNGHYITEQLILDYVQSCLQEMNNDMHIDDFLVDMYQQFGPFCKTGQARQTIKRLEKQGKLRIIRDPAFTKTGKRSQFMDEKKRSVVIISPSRFLE